MKDQLHIFTRAFDARFKLLIPLVVTAIAVVAFGGYYFMHPKRTDVGYAPRQPIAFSHALHAGDMEIPCMYCHVQVEKAAAASVPTTSICMNCHSVVRSARGATAPSAEIAKIVKSWETGTPIRWVRVHKVPDYVYFQHGRHIQAGVDCRTCHGDVATMSIVRQVAPLSMGWCLDCHRDPAPEIVTKVSDLQIALASGARKAPDNCSACHR